MKRASHVRAAGVGFLPSRAESRDGELQRCGTQQRGAEILVQQTLERTGSRVMDTIVIGRKNIAINA